MFTVSKSDVQTILEQFGIREKIVELEELLRYRYEAYDPGSREVRLIVKIGFLDRTPLVVKFKNEEGVTRELIQAQILFSQHLDDCGIPTARFYWAADSYVLHLCLNDYEVFVTVEDFCDGEIKLVDLDLAEQTGRLLGLSHNISERDNCHVPGPVLFDPFGENDLFSYERFAALQGAFTGEDGDRFDRITQAYERHMAALAPLRDRPRYAVQGDLSDCNLFRAPNGQVGMFDFNRCGDNILFCDAIMEGVFEARLMDYGQELTESYARAVFVRFLRGYDRVRPFTDLEISLMPHLCALIAGFWLMDLSYGENSLSNLVEAGQAAEASAALARMERRIDAVMEWKAS